MKLKTGSLKRNKTDKLLARLRKRNNSNKIRNEIGNITTDPTETKRIMMLL